MGKPDLLMEIFKRQNELWDKYKVIEGDLPDGPVEINSYSGQRVIKDFLWRITEEIMEAVDALGKNDKDLIREELSDALHFIVELFLITQTVPNTWVLNDIILSSRVDTPVLSRDGGQRGMEKAPLDFPQAVLRTVYRLGMVGNLLKNKPWKQTPVETDEKEFREKLNQAFISFIGVFDSSFTTAEEIHSVYMGKAEINKTRQEEKY